MKRKYFSYSWLVLMIAVLISSCGYTNKAIMPNGIQTITVPTFKDRTNQKDTYTYEAGIPIDVTNAVIDRLNFDGNLKVVSSEEADATLVGAVSDYRQEAIRFEDRSDVREYRLFLFVDIELIDNRTGEVIWVEKNFTGRTEFNRTGTNARTERAALISAREDLAKKIVDRIVEDW